MRNLRSWRLLPLVALLLGGTIFAAACGGDEDELEGGDDGVSITVGGDEEPAYYGVRISPRPSKPDYVLTDTAGEDFSIVEETEGYLTLLYVGYTHCPDACPTHMLDVARTLETLGDDVADKVKVVFVTSDPERDTPEVLRRWLDAFDEDFIGLTGNPEMLEQLQRELGMNPGQKVSLDDEGNYLVNHGSYVLAFTAEDNIAYTVYPLGFTREHWEHDIKKLAEEGWTES